MEAIYKVRVLETNEIQEWTLKDVLKELNGDHNSHWINYDETDWLGGWNDWVEGEFYSLVKEEIVEENIIEKLKLTREQVLQIVKEWYTCGMCADIFQNHNGQDLEEYLEIYLYN
jgi:hypothetical protein